MISGTLLSTSQSLAANASPSARALAAAFDVLAAVFGRGINVALPTIAIRSCLIGGAARSKIGCANGSLVAHHNLIIEKVAFNQGAKTDLAINEIETSLMPGRLEPFITSMRNLEDSNKETDQLKRRQRQEMPTNREAAKARWAKLITPKANKAKNPNSSERMNEHQDQPPFSF
jgi:hypothetical protein